MGNPGGVRPAPTYDRAAIARVARIVQIASVDLTYAHFERADAAPLPATKTDVAQPEISVDYNWLVDKEAGHTFGCIVKFGAISGDEPDPRYRLIANFRVVYETKSETPPDEHDLHQFVHYNVVFNAWPYWREYVSSTINRAGLPRTVLPVLLDPRALDPGITAERTNEVEG